MAGQRRGTEDDRHLWPEMLRAIREIQPRWVVGENVYGIVNWNGGLVFEEVQADLEAEGYEVQSVILPACGKDVPHRRERTCFVAHSETFSWSCKNKHDRERKSQKIQTGRFNEFRLITNTKNKRLERANTTRGERSRGFNSQSDWQNFPTQSPVCSGDDGIPSKLDGITFPKWRNESIKAYGNAVVPQLVYEIFKVIDKTI
jgi:DNA (cytosine-5)-methyltransferase 1